MPSKTKILLTIFLILLTYSCTNKPEKVSVIKENNMELQMIEAYNEGLFELSRGDAIYAAKKFNEAELLYPQSIWAPRSSLMAAYAYFSQAYYNDAIIELEKFLDKYKNHPQTDYAYYLMALSYYDQIVDETKDMMPINFAKKYFKLVKKNYPDTEFAMDASFKLDLIKEIEASKEMYIARYYLDREKWIPAINRFKVVVNEYDNTIFVEEALHRLVEVHYKIGLVEESKKYATLLGYNYSDSVWYEKSYIIFNKNYKKILNEDKKESKNSIFKRLKELLK
tara:strand:+ start:559 stop:1401 length:843 start_codon:yes stop_codon:yes gene_type:complete